MDRAYLNPFSKHNIGKVIVHRFDKAGAPIVGRERVCLNLIPAAVNKCLEHFEFPIPKIDILKDKHYYIYVYIFVYTFKSTFESLPGF